MELKARFGSPCSIETAAVNWKGCRSQNPYINDKHLLIQKAVSEEGDFGTSVYYRTIKAGKCWYLSLDLCLFILNSLRWANASQNWASLLCYRTSFRKRFLLQTYPATSCTVEAKVLFKVCLQAQILLSIANSTSKCSAQSLGSKVTNRRRGSFPKGHVQSSGFKFFWTCIVWMLQHYWLFTKILCYLLFSISVSCDWSIFFQVAWSE